MNPESSPPGVAPETSLSLSLRASDRGVRLDRLLSARLGLSRSQVRRLLADGSVSLDGRVRGYSDKGLLLPGEGQLEVRPFRSGSRQRVTPACGVSVAEGSEGSDECGGAREADRAVRVLARGPGWLAVDKPAGWPVHPLREDEVGTVLNAVAAEHPEIQGVGDEGGLRSGVVHRLDVGTSGVLLFATEDAQWSRLRAAFRDHRVEKLYRTLVVGDLQSGASLGEWGEPMELELAVARHRPARVRVVDGSASGSRRRYRARQSLRVVERLNGASLVEVRIVTGFLHQIRVSLAHLGHAVVGDALYGDPNALALGARRQLLHAARLRFEEVSAESPDPRDFREMLQQLRGETAVASGSDRPAASGRREGSRK